LIHLTGVNLDAKTVDLSIDRFVVIPLCVEASFQLLKLLYILVWEFDVIGWTLTLKLHIIWQI